MHSAHDQHDWPTSSRLRDWAARPRLVSVIYLDYNATAPLLPEVRETTQNIWSKVWGNPSSSHRVGREAKSAMQEARRHVANLIGAEIDEVVFTSGATESNNLAIFSALADHGSGKIVTTAVEHASVRSPCVWLRNKGALVVEAPVDENGSLDLDAFARFLPGATLASVIWANNETGVIFPIEEIAELCAANRVSFHVDAVQAVGKLPIDVGGGPKIDYLSLSGHKLGAPKGVGALYVRAGARLHPMFFGGDQENTRRPGTENVLSIVGFGVAAREAARRLSEMDRLTALRDDFELRLLAKIPGAQINCAGASRIGNTINISLPVEDSEGLLMLLDQQGVLASSGSACHAASLDPSHVLLAMGLDRRRAKRSVRFSLGFETTERDLHAAVDIIVATVDRLSGVTAR